MVEPSVVGQTILIAFARESKHNTADTTKK